MPQRYIAKNEREPLTVSVTDGPGSMNVLDRSLARTGSRTKMSKSSLYLIGSSSASTMPEHWQIDRRPTP